MKTREIQLIKISRLVKNTGEQIPGLKTNPRKWTSADIDRLASSIRATPELFEGRPLLAAPIPGDEKGRLVILGGNLRLDAGKRLGEKELPVIVYEDTPADVLNAIVIKDNGSFGSWDYDTLANEWDDLPLNEWGVPAWDTASPETNTTEDDYTERDTGDFTGVLPPELSDIDLSPSSLERLAGDDKTALQRVIIVYPEDRADEVAQRLGLADGISKVVYPIDELWPEE